MSKEEVVNFSSEDAENVTIPESLSPIAYEFFETLVYRMKKLEASGLITECLRIFSRIQDLRPNFLYNEHRFLHKVFPIITRSMREKPLRQEYYSLSELRMLIEAVKLANKVLDDKNKRLEDSGKNEIVPMLAELGQHLSSLQHHYEKQSSNALYEGLVSLLKR